MPTAPGRRHRKLVKLTGRNFQPWDEFSMVIEGLTLIVGPSNRGKSSVFRSLKGALRNDLPAGFVKDGQPGPLEVTVETDGHVIRATRPRKGSSKYVVDGSPFASLQLKVPEPVEKLRFGEVQVGGTTIDPIFSEQNRAQFLIDPERWKPNEVNAVLGAFSSTEKLDAGKKEANLRITQRNAEAKTLAEEIREAEERKAALSRLAEASGQALVLVDGFESGAGRCESLLSFVAEALRKAARVRRLGEILSPLQVPDASGAERLHRKDGLLAQAHACASRIAFLAGFGASLDQALAAWESSVGAYKLLRGLLALSEARKKEAGPRKHADLLSSVLKEAESFLNPAVDYLDLAGSVRDARSLRAAFQSGESELEKAGKELEEAGRGLREIEQGVREAEEERRRAAASKASGGTARPKCDVCGGYLACPVCGEQGQKVFGR